VFLLRLIRAQARLHLSLSAALLDSRHRAGVDKPAAETADVHMTDAEPARAKPPPADGTAAPAPQPPAPGKGAAAPEAPAAAPAAAPARKEPVSEPMPDDGDEEEEDEGDSAARVEELRRIDEELAKADDRRAGPGAGSWAAPGGGAARCCSDRRLARDRVGAVLRSAAEQRGSRVLQLRHRARSP